MPFCGVTERKTSPLRQIELPVTFEEQDNFRMENVVFDMVDFDVPYNAILGASRWPRRPQCTILMAR